MPAEVGRERPPHPCGCSRPSAPPAKVAGPFFGAPPASNGQTNPSNSCYQGTLRETAIGRTTMTMHDFEAKHWIIAAVIIVVAVGAFAYSWS